MKEGDGSLASRPHDFEKPIRPQADLVIGAAC